MHERYTNREQYFLEQSYTTEKHVLPFLKQLVQIVPGINVLEVGCGEGGNLKPFLDIGCKVVGVDLAKNKINNAKIFFQDHPQKENLKLLAENIYNINPTLLPAFDLIIMRDTLEHIHNQDVFLNILKKFIRSTGKIFVAFPPWRMPFAGHQQICQSKVLSKLPYFHLLPRPLYKLILKIFGESDKKIESLLEINDTRITIRKYKRILRKQNYKLENEVLYLVNPNYEIKFGMKTKKLPRMLNIPYFRDFFTTTYYSIISV